MSKKDEFYFWDEMWNDTDKKLKKSEENENKETTTKDSVEDPPMES